MTHMSSDTSAFIHELNLCVSAGGILFPCGVSVSDSGGGNAHQAGAGQGRAGEVPAVQRHLHCNEEGKGNICLHDASFIRTGPSVHCLYA